MVRIVQQNNNIFRLQNDMLIVVATTRSQFRNGWVTGKPCYGNMPQREFVSFSPPKFWLFHWYIWPRHARKKWLLGSLFFKFGDDFLLDYGTTTNKSDWTKMVTSFKTYGIHT